MARYNNADAIVAGTQLRKPSDAVYTGAGGTLVAYMTRLTKQYSNLEYDYANASTTTFNNLSAGTVISIGIIKATTVPDGMLVLWDV